MATFTMDKDRSLMFLTYTKYGDTDFSSQCELDLSYNTPILLNPSRYLVSVARLSLPLNALPLINDVPNCAYAYDFDDGMTANELAASRLIRTAGATLNLD